MWATFFIVLAIGLIVGGFSWVRPSPRDKILAELRLDAIRQGLKVTQVQVPDLTEEGRVDQRNTRVTVYRQMQQAKMDGQAYFMILRTSGESGIYLPDGWTWVDDKRLIQEPSERVSNFLASLPDEIVAVEVTQGSVGVGWQEKKLTLEQIKAYLKDVNELF